MWRWLPTEQGWLPAPLPNFQMPHPAVQSTPRQRRHRLLRCNPAHLRAAPVQAGASEATAAAGRRVRLPTACSTTKCCRYLREGAGAGGWCRGCGAGRGTRGAAGPAGIRAACALCAARVHRSSCPSAALRLAGHAHCWASLLCRPTVQLQVPRLYLLLKPLSTCFLAPISADHVKCSLYSASDCPAGLFPTAWHDMT